MKTHEFVYALYKGDKFLDIGTLQQLSEKHNMKLSTLRFLLSPANRRRRKGNGLLIINIGSVDDNVGIENGRS